MNFQTQEQVSFPSDREERLREEPYDSSAASSGASPRPDPLAPSPSSSLLIFFPPFLPRNFMLTSSATLGLRNTSLLTLPDCTHQSLHQLGVRWEGGEKRERNNTMKSLNSFFDIETGAAPGVEEDKFRPGSENATISATVNSQGQSKGLVSETKNSAK